MQVVLQERLVSATPLTEQDVTADKLETPAIVTDVEPVLGPKGGVMLAMVGALPPEEEPELEPPELEPLDDPPLDDPPPELDPPEELPPASTPTFALP